MDELDVFSVFFDCKDAERVKDWLNGYTPTAGYAYGELLRFGSVEFKGPVFAVQFLSKSDEVALREHFYPLKDD